MTICWWHWDLRTAAGPVELQLLSKSFYPGHRWKAKSSIYFQSKDVFKDPARISMGLWKCLLLLQRFICSGLPCIMQWTPRSKCNLKNHLWFTATFSNDCAPSKFCYFCRICFISQSHISEWPQGRVSLPVEARPRALVAVSGAVTGPAAVFSKAPVAHQAPVTAGTCHSGFAVAESCPGVAPPAAAQRGVGWTHGLAGTGYGHTARGNSD